MIKKTFLPLESLYIFSLITLPLLYILQGIDFTDTGWVLSNYQQIFNDPQSVSYWFHLWLTNITGGIWNTVFGWGGLLSFKLAAVLIFWITAFLVYKLYHHTVTTKKFLLVALLLGMVLHFSAKIPVIHYNNLSMLFLTLGALFIFKAFESESTKRTRLFFFFSGAALSAAVFTRFPNITGMSFALVILYRGVKEKTRFSAIAGNILSFAAGVLISAAAAFAAMKMLGHLQLYFNSIVDLFSSSEELVNYGKGVMIKRFLRHWFKALVSAGFLFILSAVIYKISANKKPLRIFFYVAALAGAGIFSYFYGWTKPDEFIIFPGIGIIALTCFLVFFFLGEEYEKQKLLSLLTALLICVLSFGSDTGMTVGAYGVLFGLPLVFWFWHEAPEIAISLFSEEKNKRKVPVRIFAVNLTETAKKHIIGLILVIYAAYGIPFFLRDIYRDNSRRWTMTVAVNHSLLRGVFTTPERASSIESLITALDKYVRKNDFLLTYDSIPMVCFLTKTRPYLYNSWPILYSPLEFQNALDKARRERADLPVTVLAKIQIRSKTWPLSGEVSGYESANKNRNMLYDFLQQEGYRKIWENNAFEILLPPGK
jgi:MFS family permease